MRQFIALVLICFLVWTPLAAQQTKPTPQKTDKPIPSGATIFIEKMEQDLDGFIRASMVKKKVPLTIVLKPEDADLIMTGSGSTQEKRSWHEGWLSPEKDHALGNVTIIERKTEKFVWAGEAGDRSLWWGALRRGGQRRVADRIANSLKEAIAK